MQRLVSELTGHNLFIMAKRAKREDSGSIWMEPKDFSFFCFIWFTI